MERGDQIQLMHFLDRELRRSERELVELLVREGLTNKELADRLGRSTKTVANQLTFWEVLPKKLERIAY